MQTKPKSSKSPRSIAYWVVTGLLAAALLTGGAAELASSPAAIAATRALGYPAYFLIILGVWKVLSVPALLAPRLPRLKEWAYAGIFFDLTGAAASHAFSGDPPGKIATPLVLLVIAAASWALRPPSRTCSSDSKPRKHAQAAAPPEDVAAHA
jgi:membrane protease YdiL (CAAX protease family)